MTNKTCVIFAAIACATPAFGQSIMGGTPGALGAGIGDPGRPLFTEANASFTSQPISFGEGTEFGTVPTDVYDSIAGGATGYAAFAPGNGAIGFDDYTTTEAAPFNLNEFGFVGGVDAIGGLMTIEFFNAAGDTLLQSFDVALPSAGNFIWTITFGGPVIPETGIVQLSVPDALSQPVPGPTGPVLGQFFLSDGPITVGSNDNTFGGANGGAFHHNFRLNVPTPGGIAVLALGGFAAVRRRR